MFFHLWQAVFVLFLAVQIDLHIHICCQFFLIRVIVTHVFIQAFHFLHLFVGQFETEDIEVCLDVLRIRRTRDDDISNLGVPS